MTPTSPQIGQLLGAQALVNQAEAYGFNQQIPLDVPADTVAVSNFGTVADFADDIPGLMKSAIGQQNVTASALQMALVAGHGGQRRRGDDPPRDGADPRLPGQSGARSTNPSSGCSPSRPRRPTP